MKFIVIGASAGSLDVIQRILSTLPSGLNAAILVVRHISPDAERELGKILARRCQLPIYYVEENLLIKPGHVYIAPPGYQSGIKQEKDDSITFTTRPILSKERGTPNIDYSVVSAAKIFGGDCILVILSGYLDDGTRGAQFLNLHDGLTIVQDPLDAEVDSMPLNVIRRDSPNYIRVHKEISELLVDLTNNLSPNYFTTNKNTAEML